jgi:isoquinoline 1-oxidoreductase subunit alpha
MARARERGQCYLKETGRVVSADSYGGLDTMNVTLRVNGRSHTVDVPADMPLLWVLRDVLDLKGTKFGCGMAQCGACTVHLNGSARLVRAPPRRRGGPTSDDRGPLADGTHPLQQAWMELDVPQCGYCQAGQLMSAAALLERTPTADRRGHRCGMNGNLCRCATYLRIRQAVHTSRRRAATGGRLRRPRRQPERRSDDAPTPDVTPAASFLRVTRSRGAAC